MKAIVIDRYGPPSVLRLEDVPRPEPAAGEVLVRVRATAVNDWDWGYVRGKPYIYRLLTGVFRPKTRILGAEVAGTVEALGEGVTRFAPGDDVYGDISEAGFGGFAEYVCVAETALGPKPPTMSFEQAAALPHAGMLALQGLVDVGNIRQGERVLINGAGGGVGTIGVQIAKQFDAEVTGVDSGIKLDLMRSFGFDHVIDYTQEDFTARGERYDLILDTKTTRAPQRFLRALKPGGRYATVGGTPRRIIEVLVMGPLIGRLSGKRIQLVALKPNSNLGYVNDLFEKHGLKLAIDGPYPLSEVAAAVQRFGEANHLGKVVITVG